MKAKTIASMIFYAYLFMVAILTCVVGAQALQFLTEWDFSTCVITIIVSSIISVICAAIAEID